MSRLAVRILAAVLTLSVLTTGVVSASAPGSKETEKEKGKDGGGAKTVTEAETEAKLKGTGTQAAAKGHAESKVITVTVKATGATTTQSSLSASVKKLTLADGSVVTFQVAGNTVGTGTVKSGQASLRLSTKKGNTVPTVNAGDSFSVLDTDGTTVILSGQFGPIKTDTETSGK